MIKDNRRSSLDRTLYHERHIFLGVIGCIVIHQQAGNLSCLIYRSIRLIGVESRRLTCRILGCESSDFPLNILGINEIRTLQQNCGLLCLFHITWSVQSDIGIDRHIALSLNGITPFIGTLGGGCDDCRAYRLSFDHSVLCDRKDVSIACSPDDTALSGIARSDVCVYISCLTIVDFDTLRREFDTLHIHCTACILRDDLHEFRSEVGLACGDGKGEFCAGLLEVESLAEGCS